MRRHPRLSILGGILLAVQTLASGQLVRISAADYGSGAVRIVSLGQRAFGALRERGHRRCAGHFA